MLTHSLVESDSPSGGRQATGEISRTPSSYSLSCLKGYLERPYLCVLEDLPSEPVYLNRYNPVIHCLIYPLSKSYMEKSRSNS